MVIGVSATLLLAYISGLMYLESSAYFTLFLQINDGDKDDPIQANHKLRVLDVYFNSIELVLTTLVIILTWIQSASRDKPIGRTSGSLSESLILETLAEEMNTTSQSTSTIEDNTGSSVSDQSFNSR